MIIDDEDESDEDVDEGISATLEDGEEGTLKEDSSSSDCECDIRCNKGDEFDFDLDVRHYIYIIINMYVDMLKCVF